MRSLLLAAALTGCVETKRYELILDTGPGASVDEDGDGFSPADGDCDDTDPEVHPDADEVCDGVNNDCDAGIDEDAVDARTLYMDGDGDGYGDAAVTLQACGSPPGFLDGAGDCDDDDAAVHPGAEEICNDGIDNNCNDDLSECTLAGTLPLEDATRLTGESPGDRFGSKLTGAGDVNADGLADFVVSSPRSDARGNDSGTAYLFLGPVEASGSAAAADARLLAITAGQQAGGAVAAAGDLNADGYGDLIVGAPRADAGGTDAGDAYVLLGPLTGDVVLNEASLRVIGEISYDLAGVSVAGVPDATGDGVGDLLVGATGYGDGGFQNRGSAYLVSGASTGNVDLSSAQARILGTQRYDRLGSTVAGLADINGDGLGDVASSGVTYPGNDGVGAVFVFHGPLTGNVNAADASATFLGPAEEAQAGTALAAGDLDGDGYDDLVASAPNHTAADDEEGAVFVVLGPLDAGRALSEADGIVTGAVRRDRIGDSVDAGPDVNRDGIGDLLIGAVQADTEEAGTDSGQAWLFTGPVEGSLTTDDAAVRLPAAASRDGAGSSVAFAGDTNGDGLADVLVGALDSDAAGTDAGAAYLLLGTSY